MGKVNAFLEALGDGIEDVDEGQSILAIVMLVHK